MKYINFQTKEIENSKTEFNFEVDDLMAETISILNKKGYFTTACCSGHTEYNDWVTEMPKEEVDNEITKGTIKKEQIIKELDGSYKVGFTITGANIYIGFVNTRFLKTNPEIEGIFRTDTLISKALVLEENGKFKNKKEITKEIEEVNSQFLKWAKSLPNLLEVKEK